MEKQLALFIEDLEYGLRTTTRAEDRARYETYLAHAACMLARLVLNKPKAELFKVIDTFEKLRGNTWLSAPMTGQHPDSYRKFKELAGYPGYDKA